MSKYKKYQKRWKEKNRKYCKEYARKYREKNKEKIKKQLKDWYQKNKKKRKEYHKEWRRKNPDYDRKWSKKNIERRREIRREWNRRNPEKTKNIYQNYRARKLNAEGSFTVKEWEAKKKEFDYCCAECGRQEPKIKLEQDHIIPLSRGGTNYIRNIQPLCRSCNVKKGNKIYESKQHKKR